MELAGKKVAVIGLGRSGAAAARFLFERGARLVLIDRDHMLGRSAELPPGELHLGAAVTACDENGLVAGGVRIAAGTVLWAAGVGASPAAAWLEAAHDRNRRVTVEADLSLPGDRNIFVIGDTAHVRDEAGKPLPGVAPVAKQEGRYVARLIAGRVAGASPPKPFRYRDQGALATIGRSSAIADLPFIKLTGWPAWVLWGIVHIYFLIGFRNRLSVFVNWVWAWLTYARGARLITGDKRVE